MIKKILLIVLVLLLALAGYVWYQFSTNKGGGFNGDQAKKLEIKSSTSLFDEGIKAMLASYFNLKEAFVNADTTNAKAACNTMIKAIDSIKLEELQKDTSGLITTIQPLLNDVKSNAVSLMAQTSIKEMRKDFNQVNQQMYSLLKAINYKGEKIYWQNCPMAFDGDKEAYWLDTKTGDARTNPYLGKNDPEHGSNMLHCGEDKDSIMAK
jgi:flagellar basal body-associated protein FliL